ncbi:LEAF RUST 10 DISEASE-RESISTANCE LOCUS RECEPTOR-LIKE PROTEIN KINASE-like 1.1 [Senna tora]|uniref:LEAF RUST 10 DISEASE-RESISTANCE LOCUS RECEPTOR-LIKE PROTEIN KINASE-like 1.1 n=1 Tax=Senna tora TaxID=362788 RepID=A0A834XB48_9FABA|nr:LEAF RUST 10 DISEASE-RESISTANCE LOCUS RECEPTOR-LIKE PROTEIN KINASE-like 1.1 [Senna tora]
MGAGVSEVRKQGAESVELVDKGHEIPLELEETDNAHGMGTGVDADGNECDKCYNHNRGQCRLDKNKHFFCDKEWDIIFTGAITELEDEEGGGEAAAIEWDSFGRWEKTASAGFSAGQLRSMG